MFSVQRAVVPQQVEICDAGPRSPSQRVLLEVRCTGMRCWLLFRLPPAMAEHPTDSLLNPEVFSIHFSIAGEGGTAAWCLHPVVVRGVGPPGREGLFAHGEHFWGCTPCWYLVRSIFIHKHYLSSPWVKVGSSDLLFFQCNFFQAQYSVAVILARKQL